MMFKNSFKLLLANFQTFWKLLLYKLIVVFIIGGLFCVSLPALSNLSSIDEFTTALNTFLLLDNFNANIFALFEHLFNLVDLLFTIVMELLLFAPWMFVYLILLFFIILPTLWHFADIAVGETLYGFMASQTKYGFVGSIIRKLKSCLTYALVLALISLPINAIIFAGAYGILSLMSFGGLIIYAIPFILFAFLVLMLSLKTTFLSGFMPAMVVFNCGEFSGFKRGLKAVSRRFFRTWSTSAILWILILLAVSFFGVFASIVIIPIASLWLSIFQMVMFFGSQGMRFYVDMDTFIIPKKLEETDRASKAKNVI